MRARPEQFRSGGRLLATAVAVALLGSAIPAAAPPPALAADPVTALYADGGGTLTQGRAVYETTAGMAWSATLSDGGNAVDLGVAYEGYPTPIWSIHLAAPEGQALAVGAYGGATKPQQAGTPGLDVSRGYLGCYSAIGAFTIVELAASSGVVTALAVSIEYRCGDAAAPADWLDVRLASTVPLRGLLPAEEPVGLGEAVGGQTGAAHEIAVTATGTAPTAITSAAVEGANPGDFTITADACTGATLDPGTSCALSVAFTPTATGWRQARVTLAADTYAGHHAIDVSGTGLAYGISTLALDFGSVPLWTTGSRTVTFVNGADARTLSGFNAWWPEDSTNPYAVRPGTGCTANPQVPAFGTCDITVDFTPRRGGTNAATLYIGVGSDTIWATLTGVGTPLSKVAWGTERTVYGGAWTSGKALARTATSSTTYLHAAVTTNNNGSYLGAYYRRSSTTGRTWTKPVRVNPAKQHADRVVVAASGSRVYVAWVSQTKWARYSPTAPRTIYVRSNATHGSGSWGTIRRITSLTGRVDYPAIAASGSLVYVAFTDASTGAVKVAISRDRGRTWATKKLGTTALAAGKEGRTGMPSVSAYGSLVVVAWTADRYGKVVVKTSTNAGRTWSSSSPTTSAQGYASTAAASGRLVVAWPVAEGLRLKTWRSTGWGPVVTAASPGVPGAYAWTDTGAVALAGTAQVGAAWVACSSKCSSDWPVLDVVWAESKDGGVTFPFRQVAVEGREGGASYPQNYSPSVVWLSSTSRALMFFATFQFESWSTHLRAGSGSPS